MTCILLYWHSCVGYRILEYTYTDGSGSDDEIDHEEIIKGEDTMGLVTNLNGINENMVSINDHAKPLTEIRIRNPGLKISEKHPVGNETVFPQTPNRTRQQLKVILLIHYELQLNPVKSYPQGG